MKNILLAFVFSGLFFCNNGYSYSGYSSYIGMLHFVGDHTFDGRICPPDENNINDSDYMCNYTNRNYNINGHLDMGAGITGWTACSFTFGIPEEDLTLSQYDVYILSALASYHMLMGNEILLIRCTGVIDPSDWPTGKATFLLEEAAPSMSMLR